MLVQAQMASKRLLAAPVRRCAGTHHALAGGRAYVVPSRRA
jgi:hypothetical protein